MRVAIVGSRDFGPLQSEAKRRVLACVRSMLPGTTIVSGGAPGVDTWAEEEARARGLPLDIKRARWRRLDGSIDRGAGFARNVLIASECDHLVAFWNGSSRGTADTIGHARRMGRSMEVVELR